MPLLDGRDVGVPSICACGHMYGDHTQGLFGPCTPCTCLYFHWPAPGPPDWPGGTYDGGLPIGAYCTSCGIISGNHAARPPHAIRERCIAFTYPSFVAGKRGPQVTAAPLFDYAAAPIEGAEDEELRALLTAGDAL